MFRVAICDDEETSLKLNKALAEKILEEENISYEICTYTNMIEMTEALVNVKKAAPFDVLLSDILATDMNGIEAAEKLRGIGEQLDIIFISSTAEYALDGYRVQALRYLKKPVDLEQLREALLISYRKHTCKEGLAINIEGKMTNINYKDIYYIESCGREVDIHVDGRVLPAHIKISDMEKMLPEKEFFRCHRSYIVNFKNMEKLERYEITMKDGDIISVSQQLYAETKNRFTKCQYE